MSEETGSNRGRGRWGGNSRAPTPSAHAPSGTSGRIMNRRQFLKVGVGAAATAAAAGIAAYYAGWFRSQPPVVGPAEEVVIVGGGFSGLTAAMILAARGKEVVVLERDDHPGGRVLSAAWPNGQRFEAGFEEFFNEASYPHTWWLIRELGLESQVVQYPSDVRSFLRGSWNPPWRNTQDEADFNRLVADAIDAGTFPDNPWTPEGYGAYDSMSMRDFTLSGYNSSGTGDVDWLASLYMNAETGVESDRNSAAHVLDNFNELWTSPGYHLRDGNDGFIHALIDRKLEPGTVLFNSEVVSVRNADDGRTVEVVYDDPSGRHTITTGTAIVAVPHTRVRSIVDLPADRLASLNALPSSRVIRTVHQFSARPWEPQFTGWGFLTDRTPSWVNNDSSDDSLSTGSLSPYIDEPNLDSLWVPLTQEQAKATRTSLDSAAAQPIVSAVLQDLDLAFPGAASQVAGSRVWEVPYYGPVYPPRYVLDGHYARNLAPLGRILFAGDWLYGFGADHAIARGRDVAAIVE